MRPANPQRLSELYQDACALDVKAAKPGNVSESSAGHGMTAADFLFSAERTAALITRPDITLGERILGAVAETRRAVGCNTNLGIVLLCAPLIQAALDFPLRSLREGVACVLRRTTVSDADSVYRAIRVAEPAGLGELDEHDVAQPARLTLVGAMRKAADRDLIARQYANGFGDLFDEMLPYLQRSLDAGRSLEAAIVDLFLFLLAHYPDSHIVRKQGPTAARSVVNLAIDARARIDKANGEAEVAELIAELDQALKSQGLNPGTSADFCVACALSHCLQWQTDNDAGAIPDNPRSARPERAAVPL